MTATMAGGGTERVIAGLANYFAKKGEDITILLTADNRVEYELNEKIKVIQIGEESGGKFSRRLQRLWSLRRYISKNKDSVFLSFGTETNMFAILASFLMKRNLLISERNDPSRCSFVGKRNFLYRFAAKHVFQTEVARDYFSDKIKEHSRVIPNPVSSEVPDRYIGIRKKEIVAVGRLEEQKNHKLLLESFSDFLDVYKDFKLKIYGKGKMKQELEMYAIELGIQDRVCFADFASDVLEQIRDSYMYVLASDYEGISNSLLEAMVLGIPVISTDCPCGGSRMLIKNYENGILVPVGDRKALTFAMVQLVEDEILAERIAKEAAKLKADYSIESIAKMWEEYMLE